MSVKQYSDIAHMDYGKLTVVKLKDELKLRGIPSTGLTRKQHFIDRLVQEDAKTSETPTLVAEQATESVASVGSPPEDPKRNVTPPTNSNDNDDLVKGTPSTILQAEQAAHTVDPHSIAPAVEILATKTNEPPDARVIEKVDRTDGDAGDHFSTGEHKRKRRSHTPPIVQEELAQKKLKHDNAPTIVFEQDIDTSNTTQDIKRKPNLQGSSDVVGAEPATSHSALAGRVDTEGQRVSPSLHPPTAALYIRNLKRPLQPLALRQHLVALAKEDNPILTFHLDAIRTHAFVQFSSVSTASSVRLGLHDRVWPAERDREPLWVDFVPENELAGWIGIESETDSVSRGTPARRWEVVYSSLADGSVTTMLQACPQHPVSTGYQDGRQLPEGNIEQVQPNPTSFIALDKLFRSTVAKPKLYWLPAQPRLVDDRLIEIDAFTTKRRSYPKAGSGLSDSRRYTFEHGDRLVDNGPEFGLRGGGSTRGDIGRGRGQAGRRSGDRWG